MVHIRMTLTLLICIKKLKICVQIQAQNVYFLKHLAPHLRIPYRSNVSVKTMTEVHVSTHFHSD